MSVHAGGPFPEGRLGREGRSLGWSSGWTLLPAGGECMGAPKLVSGSWSALSFPWLIMGPWRGWGWLGVFPCCMSDLRNPNVVIKSLSLGNAYLLSSRSEQHDVLLFGSIEEGIL